MMISVVVVHFIVFASVILAFIAGVSIAFAFVSLSVSFCILVLRLQINASERGLRTQPS